MKNTTKTTTRTSNAAKGESWETFTDAELAKAVELMVTPADLTIRGAALALLKVLDLTPEDVREQLAKDEYFNDGAVFFGLDTEEPGIYWNFGTLTPKQIRAARAEAAK